MSVRLSVVSFYNIKYKRCYSGSLRYSGPSQWPRNFADFFGGCDFASYSALCSPSIVNQWCSGEPLYSVDHCSTVLKITRNRHNCPTAQLYFFLIIIDVLRQ